MICRYIWERDRGVFLDSFCQGKVYPGKWRRECNGVPGWEIRVIFKDFENEMGWYFCGNYCANCCARCIENERK